MVHDDRERERGGGVLLWHVSRTRYFIHCCLAIMVTMACATEQITQWRLCRLKHKRKKRMDWMYVDVGAFSPGPCSQCSYVHVVHMPHSSTMDQTNTTLPIHGPWVDTCRWPGDGGMDGSSSKQGKSEAKSQRNKGKRERKERKGAELFHFKCRIPFLIHLSLSPPLSFLFLLLYSSIHYTFISSFVFMITHLHPNH